DSDFNHVVAARVSGRTSLTGTYTVIVQDLNRTGTADYRITLNKSPGPFAVSSGDEGGPLANGATETGHIAYPGDIDAWTFSANPGDIISIGVSITNLSATFNTHLIVTAPDGSPFDADFNHGATANVSGQTSQSGTYTVIVQDLNRTGTADYSIIVSVT